MMRSVALFLSILSMSSAGYAPKDAPKLPEGVRTVTTDAADENDNDPHFAALVPCRLLGLRKDLTLCRISLLFIF